MKKILLFLMLVFSLYFQSNAQFNKLYSTNYSFAFEALPYAFSCQAAPLTYNVDLTFYTNNYASNYSVSKTNGPTYGGVGNTYQSTIVGDLWSPQIPHYLSYSDNFHTDSFPLNSTSYTTGENSTIICGVKAATNWYIYSTEVSFNIIYNGSKIICDNQNIIFNLATPPHDAFSLQVTNTPLISSSWQPILTTLSNEISFNQSLLPQNINKGVPTYFRITGNYAGYDIQSDYLALTFYPSIPTPQTKTIAAPTCFGGKGSVTLSDFKYSDGTSANGEENLSLGIYRVGSGTPEKNINFYGGDITVSDLAPGDYTAQIGTSTCSENFDFTIPAAPAQLTASATVQNPDCSSGSGTITATASAGTPPYQYSINGGTTYQTSNVFSNLSSGSYTVTITDANNCTPATSAALNVVIPTAVNVTLSNKRNPSGAGLSNGQIVVAASGGTGSTYMYAINDGTYASAETFSSLAAGTYNITAKDSKGCVSVPLSVVLTEPQPLTASLSSKIDNNCFGASLGTIEVSVSGGVAPYSYAIGESSYQTNNSFTNLAAGDYSITIKDANGNIATLNTTISQPAKITANVVKTDATCYGGNGNITINNVAGGSGSTYSYSSDGGVNYQSGNVFSLPQGTYTIKIKDENGCSSDSYSITINQPAASLSATATKQDVACYGASNGNLKITATGGSGSYSYSIDNWLTSNTTGEFAGLPSGTYAVKVKDQAGCTFNLSIQINQPQELQLYIDGKTDALCFGGTGTISVSTTGGQGNITYSSTPSLSYSNGLFSGASAGTYVIQIIDENGCTKTANVTINQPGQLSITATTNSVSCNGASDGSVTLSASGGTGTYTYSIKNLNTYSSSSTFNGLAAGSHSFTVKDQNGCTAEITVTVNQPDALAIATSAKSNVTCSGAANGSITVTASGGNGGYTYQLNGTDMGSVSTFTGLAAGSYTIRVNDAKGCTMEITETITQPNSLVLSLADQTNIQCNGGSTGSVTVGATGGTAPHQYSIDGTNFQPAPTFGGLAAGSYSISVRDANGCTATLAVELAQPNALSLGISTKTDVTCNGSGNGSVMLAATGGTAPYSYRIGTAAPKLSNKFESLSGGSYALTVTDANGCTASTSVTIAEPSQLTVAASTTAVGCNGGSDGSVSLSASGGMGTYTYSVKNNNSFSSSSTFSGLAAGSHSFTVKDQNGCTADITVTVNQPDALALATSTKSNVTCNGAANGSFTVTAIGGTTPYRYSLNGSTDGLNSIFTGLAAGSYTIRVTDAKGCTREITENITQPNNLVVSVTDKTDILCNGGSTGSVTVGATGGTAPYQYSIDGTNFQSAPTFSGLAAGSYTVSVKDANNCSSTLAMELVQPDALSLGISTKTDVTCSGSGNGSVTLAATGGTAPYRYRIGTQPFQLSNRFENLAGGSYTVTVTDANGCSATASFTIAEPAQLSLSASTTAVGCNGGSDGSVSLSASGGTGTYTYSIKNLNTYSSSSTFNGLAAGSHSFTVKDQNGCTTDITVTVTQPEALALATSTKSNVTCNGTANGSITVLASGGNSGYTYRLNGTDMGGVSSFTGLAPGSYTIRVTDAKGCTREITESITQPNSLVLSLADQTNILCNGGTGSITVGTTGGTAPYQYSIDGTNFQSAPTFSGLAAGSYTFSVKDANNCSSTLAVELAQPATLALGISTKTDVTCSGSGNGSVALAATGGTAPYRYRIGTQPLQLSNRFDNLAGGSYTMTVTDANGCSAAASFTIAEPAQLSLAASTTSVGCNGGSDGSVSLSASGGSGTYTYSIKNNNSFSSSSTFNGLAAGSHSFTVKDQNGCTADITITVTQPEALALATSAKSNVTCNGAANGSITVTASGGTAPYRYSLNGSTDGLNSIFTGLAAGSYTIRVTDAKGCTREITENITQPNNLVVSVTDKTDILCNGGSTGSVTVGATGGTAPYQYSIDGTNFQSGPTFSGLAAGSYTVSVKDANNCSATLAVELVQPNVLSLGISTKTDVTCNGSGNGSVTLAATGGTAPYRYRIGTQPFQLSNRFENLNGGSYTVTVTDANGCSSTASFTIAEPAQLSLSSSTTAVGCNGGSDGSVLLSASGGTGTYTYSLKNLNSFSSSSTFSGLAAGSHSFTVKDQNGCTADITVTVTQPEGLALATSAKSNVTCNGAANGSITALASGGNGGYTYQLNGKDMGSISTFTGLAAGSYTIRVTDAKGCTREVTENITEPASLALSVTDKTDILCNGGSTGSVTVGATGGTAPYQYSIDGTNFQSAPTFSGLAAGSYNISVRDANNCTSTINVIIIEPQQVTASIRKQDINCFGSASGSIEVVPSGGQSPYTYAIGSGSFQTSSSFTGLMAGNYDITVRDRNGCRYTSQVQLINATPPLAITLNANSPATCDALGNIIVANTTGGTPPYTYSVDGGSNFQTSTTFDGLSAGTYTILAMDANGCSTSATAAITVPTGISATARTTAATCHGATDGSIIVENTTGGSGVYRYSIGEGIFQSSPNFTGLTAGNYIIVVRDEPYTCQYTINVSVTQPTQITVALRSVADLTCNGVATGTLEATATGGTLPYQYSIDGTNFQSAPTFSGLAAGNYNISVRDANGCSATLAVELAQPATLALGISTKTDVTCNGSGNGSVTLAATGGTTPYRYRIGTQPFQLSNRFENLNGGSYIVTVTDANGCWSTASFTIAEPAQLTLVASTTAVGCNGGSDGSVSLSASGGTGTYAYSVKNLNSFSSSSTFSGLAAGSHSFMVKDQNGCTAEITVTVNQPDALAIATSAKSNVTCNGAANGSITVSASGGNGGYTYQLNGTDMGSVSTFTGLAAGSYTIRITDAKGCTREITENITQPNSLVVSVTDKTDILCNGGSTGSVTLQAAGGIAPYQYSIDGTNFQLGATFDGLAAGNYTVSVKDANNCSATLAVELVQPNALSLGISTKTDVTCSGSGNGSVTLAATGGTAPYRYRIGNQPLQLSNRFDNLKGGDYNFNVLDANGCAATISIKVVEPEQLTLSASTTAVGCNGGSDGSVSLSASGGTGIYTYSIKNNNSFSSSNTFSGLAAGSHSFIVKDQNGCTAEITITVTQPEALALAISAKSNVTCNGAANGSITVLASGGNGGYTYQLNGTDMGSNSTFTGLSQGNYTIRVTDAKGCTREITETITQPNSLVLSLADQTNILCNGDTGSITVGTTGGTAPYQYSIDGTNFQSGTTFGGLAAGNYNISVRDANGCMATLAVELAQPTTLALGISTKTDVTCNGSGNGSVTLAATGGTASYRYRIGTATFQLSNRFDNLKGGDYNFNVLDANGCAATISIKVVEPAQLTLAASTTAVGCNGGSDGSVSLSASGGTGTYTYSIKNNNSFSSSNTFSGLAAGSHSFTVKDQNGCTADITVTVNQPDALALATSAKINVTCNGAANGSITALASGGNGGYTYQLNGKDMGSVSTFTGLAAGSYTIRVTDAKGCTREITENITQPNSLVVSVTDKTDILCNGGSTGSVTVGTTGGTAPYQYSIDGTNFQSAPTFSGLAAGSYNISVRDANNCTGNIVATISQPSLLTLSVSAKTNVTCNGSGNGSVTLVATGGTAPYRYRIGTATFQLSNRFENLAGGSYTVTVTDANGCSTVASFTIAEPSQLSLAASTTAVGCNGGSDGSVSLSASGGTGTYTYSIKNLNNFSSSNTFSGLAAGSHSFTVKDQNGCTTDITVTVTQPDALALSTSSKNNVTCNGAANGSITVAASGGNGGYTYQLNGTDMGSVSTFTGLAAGSYTIRVTDAKRCTREITETIIQPNNLTLSLANQTNVNCFGSNTASVTIGVSGGTSPYQYSIDGSTFQSGATFSGLAVGSYTFTVKDINNCTSRITATISQPSLLALSVSSKTDVACNGAKNGTVSLTASGGTAPYRYSIGTSAYQSSNRFENLSGGNYVLNVIDANGCSATSNVTINENPALNIEVAEFKNVTCNGNHSGEITLRASGGAGNYQYSLNNGTYQSSPVFSQLAAGNYQLTVKDEKGCTSSITKMISQPLPLVVSKQVTQQKCFDACSGEIKLEVSGGTAPYTYQWSGGIYGNVSSINNLCGGLYKVTIVDANGCSIEDATTIVTPPEIMINGIADTILCVDQVITYDAGNPGLTYQWTADNGFLRNTQKVQISQAGKYQLKVTINDGCFVTKNFTIQTSTTLLKANFLASTFANVGDTVIIIDVSKPTPSKTSWIFETGAVDLGGNATGTVKQITFNAPGVYNLMMMVSLGQCTDAVQKSITVLPKEQKTAVSDALGYKEELIKEFKAYPNPNAGDFKTIIKLSTKQDIKLTLFDFNGAVVLPTQTHLGKDTYEVDFSQKNLQTGLYIVALEAGNQLKTLKIIKL